MEKSMPHKLAVFIQQKRDPPLARHMVMGVFFADLHDCAYINVLWLQTELSSISNLF